jgi:hypothetical protein
MFSRMLRSGAHTTRGAWCTEHDTHAVPWLAGALHLAHCSSGCLCAAKAVRHSTVLQQSAAAERVRRLQVAYDVFQDAEKRRAYDQGRLVH